jgi:hypothetical protein
MTLPADTIQSAGQHDVSRGGTFVCSSHIIVMQVNDDLTDRQKTDANRSARFRRRTGRWSGTAARLKSCIPRFRILSAAVSFSSAEFFDPTRLTCICWRFCTSAAGRPGSHQLHHPGEAKRIRRPFGSLRARFPRSRQGRPSHRVFRGRLGVHAYYGLSTRRRPDAAFVSQASTASLPPRSLGATDRDDPIGAGLAPAG